jgi:hypothetical protein
MLCVVWTVVAALGCTQALGQSVQQYMWAGYGPYTISGNQLFYGSDAVTLANQLEGLDGLARHVTSNNDESCTINGPPSAPNQASLCNGTLFCPAAPFFCAWAHNIPANQVTLNPYACGQSGQPTCPPPPQKAAGPSCPACGAAGRGAADAGSGGTVKGDPVDVANANSYQAEVDYVGAGTNPIRFVRSYNSITAYVAFNSPGPIAGQPLLGAVGWSATYFQYLQPRGSNQVNMYRPDGRVLFFLGPGNGVYYADADVADRLVQTSSGWQYHTADDTVETYNASGLLLSVAARGRAPVTVNYVAGATNPGTPPAIGL